MSSMRNACIAESPGCTDFALARSLARVLPGCIPRTQLRPMTPRPQLIPIAGLIAFYNEKVDVFVEGELLPRPTTHFFK